MSFGISGTYVGVPAQMNQKVVTTPKTDFNLDTPWWARYPATLGTWYQSAVVGGATNTIDTTTGSLYSNSGAAGADLAEAAMDVKVVPSMATTAFNIQADLYTGVGHVNGYFFWGMFNALGDGASMATIEHVPGAATNKVQLVTRTGGGVTTTSATLCTLANSTWTTVRLRLTSADCKLYIGGSLADTATATLPWANAMLPIYQKVAANNSGAAVSLKCRNMSVWCE